MKDALVRYLLGPLACVLYWFQLMARWLLSTDISLKSLPTGNPVERLIGRWGWFLQIDLLGTGIHFYKAGSPRCGAGCACLTQCGDFYASHSLPKPTGKV